MRKWKILVAVTIFCGGVLLTAIVFGSNEKHSITTEIKNPQKGCVFKTIFENSNDTLFKFATPESVQKSLDKAMTWIVTAQQNSGGWGAGSHSQQNVMDPHAVHADPATTSLVCMALMRNGNTLLSGKYSGQLKKGLYFLLKAVETSEVHSLTITKETGTQIQSKLGQNIDVVLTTQLLTNILDYTEHDASMTQRVLKSLDVCVTKVQRGQDVNGSFSGAGWAGVLQSSFANTALESAIEKGAKVDTVILAKSREYQKGNYDDKTKTVKAADGAGVMLYSVSSSLRASSKEAREVEEKISSAIKEGKLDQQAQATAENLQKIGYSEDKALKMATSYNVYKSAKGKAQDRDVLAGFGNNGGEEFLSFLQTGESLVINKDAEWKKWYDKTSAMLTTIQNNNGSWNGHHCITSPVFCTATCLLLLSIQNDIDKLIALGATKAK